MTPEPCLFGKRRLPACGWGLICWLGLVLSGGVRAHDVFTAYVHHRITLRAAADHLEVKFELTFFEESSAQERRLMDVNGDGQIERGELESYAKGLSGRWTNAPSVLLGAERLRVVPLYDPEVDLLGVEGVGWAHHRLVLRHFVPGAPALAVGDELRVEDFYWPSWPALAVVQGETAEDVEIRLRPEVLRDAILAPVRDGETREFRVRVVRKEPPTLPERRASANEQECYAY
jgi:hypothetical protein